MPNTLFQLRYSDDGAATFGAWRDLEKGDTGAFLRPMISRRHGRTRHRVWDFRDTSPYVADLLACALQTNGEGVWRDFPLPDGSYSDPTRPWSQQDVVNYMPTYAAVTGARSRVKYHTVPGLRAFATCGDGPHRGSRDVEGTIYTVSGSTLYRVNTDGTYAALGTIPGTGRVSMTHNAVNGGNQLVIGNRVSGYVWDTAAETLTQITDEAFAGFAYCDFLGQYIVGVDQTRRFWYHSELNDALSYNSLDRYQAETSPDRITGLLASHNEVLVFGERTIEPWANDPVNNAASTAFQLNRGAVIERGCASGFTICRLDNSVFFLGDDGKVYRLNGYTPVPVSTQAQESAWRGLDWGKAFAFTYEDSGHVVYYLTFPDGQTWGYDVPSQRWHRRESLGRNRWRLNTLFKSNGQWYGGDAYNGKTYRLDWQYPFEGLDELPRSLKTGVLHSDGNPVVVNAIRITMDTGGPEITPSASDGTQLVGPTITGSAPDGTVGVAYTYAYTTTAGDSPIVKTTIDESVLLDGLSWDETTATISGTPTVEGLMTITPRMVDTNGLFDELTDTIAIGALNWLATNGNGKFQKSVGTDWTAQATYTASATGKDLRYTNGRVLCLDNGDKRYSDDEGVTFSTTTITSGTIPSLGRPQISVHGDDFWVADRPWKGDGTSLSPIASLAVNTPPAFGDGFAVCGATSGYIYVSTNEFATSSNVNLSLSDDVTVAIGNGSRVVVVSENNGKVKYTDNGSSWSAAYTLPSFIGSAACGAASGDVFVIGAKYNTSSGAVLWVSIDGGTTFTNITLPESFYVYDIQIGGGLIVAVGEKNKGAGTPRIYTAPLDDPTNWSQSPNNFGSTDTITGIAYMGS